MIRIPFNELLHFDLPPINLTEDDYNAIYNVDKNFHSQIRYGYLNYESIHFVNGSEVAPIDVTKIENDLVVVHNCWDVVPSTVKNKFAEYFHPEFFATINNQQSIKLFIFNPNRIGLPIHKDLYGRAGRPRLAGINLVVGHDSTSADFNFYDDELNKVDTFKYEYGVLKCLNTSVFHEVVHTDRTVIRKLITIVPNEDVTIYKLKEMYDAGKLIRQ